MSEHDTDTADSVRVDSLTVHDAIGSAAFANGDAAIAPAATADTHVVVMPVQAATAHHASAAAPRATATLTAIAFDENDDISASSGSDSDTEPLSSPSPPPRSRTGRAGVCSYFLARFLSYRSVLYSSSVLSLYSALSVFSLLLVFATFFFLHLTVSPVSGHLWTDCASLDAATAAFLAKHLAFYCVDASPYSEPVPNQENESAMQFLLAVKLFYAGAALLFVSLCAVHFQHYALVRARREQEENVEWMNREMQRRAIRRRQKQRVQRRSKLIRLAPRKSDAAAHATSSSGSARGVANGGFVPGMSASHPIPVAPPTRSRANSSTSSRTAAALLPDGELQQRLL
jgi:hypothetical protein